MARTILVVEDDPETLRVLSAALDSSGYLVAGVSTGAEARSLLKQMRPDLVLLDLMLPDTDGLVLIDTLRKLTIAPIVIVSGRHEPVDRVLSLKLGADDFIAKPFDLEELDARIQAVLRRASRVTEQTPAAAAVDGLRVDELIITQSRGAVTLAGQLVRLTPTEYRLLVALASRPREVLSREVLARDVWGYQDVDIGHLIDVHVGRLRRQLQRASPLSTVIHTVRGKGYALGLEPATPVSP
jgi:DNA-binding response OmpR family regulator